MLPSRAWYKLRTQTEASVFLSHILSPRLSLHAGFIYWLRNPGFCNFFLLLHVRLKNIIQENY